MDKGGANVAEFTLTAAPRAVGKAASRELRRRGQVPAVLYGPGIESEPLAVDRQMFTRVYEKAGSSHLIDVTIEGRSDRHTVLIKEVARHPVRGTYEHVDFYRVPMDRPVVSRVPVHIAGRESRPNDGGIIVEQVHALHVRCLPAHLPEAIVVDISDLGLGETIYVSDLNPGEGVEILDAPDEAVVSVLEPHAAASGAEAAEAETTEEAAETGQETEA